MTKLIKFRNRTKNYEKIFNFLKTLINSSNNLRVKHDRFKELILSVVTNKSSNEEASTSTSLRKSYLITNHLQQDLKECECDNYIQIKNGTVDISKKFAIKTYKV
jgi:hypothetical protein